MIYLSFGGIAFFCFFSIMHIYGMDMKEKEREFQRQWLNTDLRSEDCKALTSLVALHAADFNRFDAMRTFQLERPTKNRVIVGGNSTEVYILSFLDTFLLLGLDNSIYFVPEQTKNHSIDGAYDIFLQSNKKYRKELKNLKIMLSVPFISCKMRRLLIACVPILNNSHSENIDWERYSTSFLDHVKKILIDRNDCIINYINTTQDLFYVKVQDEYGKIDESEHIRVSENTESITNAKTCLKEIGQGLNVFMNNKVPNKNANSLSKISQNMKSIAINFLGFMTMKYIYHIYRVHEMVQKIKKGNTNWDILLQSERNMLSNVFDVISKGTTFIGDIKCYLDDIHPSRSYDKLSFHCHAASLATDALFLLQLYQHIKKIDHLNDSSLENEECLEENTEALTNAADFIMQYTNTGKFSPMKEYASNIEDLYEKIKQIAHDVPAIGIDKTNKKRKRSKK